MVTVIRDGKRLTLREEDLTLGEVESALEWAEEGFRMCREGQHGISSKDVVSYRFLKERLAAAGIPYHGRGP